MAQNEKLNLYQKLAKIGKSVEVIRKNRRGFNYTYVDEEEILSKIKGGMEKFGVSLIPNIIHGTTEVTPYHYVEVKLDKEKKPIEKHINDILIKADMDWIWVNNEVPEERIVVPWTLVGQQSEASQSFGSALTYSSRYFMLKYFNVATSDDDPEEFLKKKMEADNQEKAIMAGEITKKIHEIVENHVAENPDDRPSLVKLIKKYDKSVNYFNIKDPDVASKLLEEVLGFVNKEKK